MKVVINKCFGGFGLSERAFERLIELGIPRVPRIAQVRDPDTGLWRREPRNDQKAIYDWDHPESTFEDGGRIRESLRAIAGRYHAEWLRDDTNRSHPLMVQVVEELGAAASARFAKLAVIEIPDGIDFEIDEYDGRESVREKHRSWA